MKNILTGSFLLLFVFIITSCNNYKKNKTHLQVSNASINAGKKLAAQYCGSCHLLPDPSLLDSKSWQKGVLPEMGPRLGIFYYGFQTYPSYRNDFFNVDKNFYPAQPLLSAEEWQHILDYFSATAPDSLLPAKKTASISMNKKLFRPSSPLFERGAPATSFVKIDSGRLMMCDAVANKLFLFNTSMQLIDSVKTDSAATDVIKDSDAFIICNIGVLSPTNAKLGIIERASLNNKTRTDTLYKNLMRPVQITPADINKDEKTDYIICEFGNLTGALSWLEKTDNGYVRHIIRAAPGAIRVFVNDYNQDGLPDIWALFAQGDESIFLFTNKGNGVFDSKQVLRFPPCYGSSYFELDDFNKDGFPDIVYTCGDNADYSPVLKPYHGVYVFLNDGKNNFSEKYFYPINGCYKAIAKDFDNDGDLDIATISFFADYLHHPEEGFVYLKNEGDFKFQPYSLPETRYGRWLTMDAGDFDGDGKTDLMLGNFSLTGSMIKSSIDWKKQPPFLMLKNIQ